jgi:quercetin dioxygenase-like cupin family protein
MKAIPYKDIEPKRLDSDIVKSVNVRVAIGKADGAARFCMRVFDIEKGGFTPKHSHAWEHEIFFHAGKGEVLLGDEWKAVEPGHAVFIPGNTEHQIRNTGTEDLTFICVIPSGFPEI